MQAEIDKVNAELARVEQIKAFRILPKALDPEEEGEPVTPTRKVKRKAMYERFEKIVLIHSVRATSELAYEEYLSHVLPKDEHIGEFVSKQFIYYPTVTREPYRNRGRLTDLIESGKLFEAIGLPPLNAEDDRVMICGSPSMLKDSSAILDARGFEISAHIGSPGDYVIERAFVEK